MIFNKQYKTRSFQAIFQVTISVALAFLLYTTFFKGDKVAYVDSAKLLNDYKGSEAAKKAFQKKAVQWQANIDTLTNQVKKLIGEYERSMATMPAKEQALSKQLIQAKQVQLESYQKSVKENAEQENQKLMQSLVTQINAYVTQYGKDNHYKLILIASQYGTIAYGREGTDITSTLVEGLNHEYSLHNK